MKRREFIRWLALAGLMAPQARGLFGGEQTLTASTNAVAGSALPKDWLSRWEKHILDEARNRYCDHEMGEEIGWLISPFLNGFYYGYRATGSVQWIERLSDWASAWIQRGIQEPDGFIGWPKRGTGGAVAEELYTDSLLGEAMGLRPLVLMAAEILKTPALKKGFRREAEGWLKLAGQVFEKWSGRGCWREAGGGGLWVVPSFGIDKETGHWTDGYGKRGMAGFSNPANKQNHIARWLIAMHDATGKPVYRERAEMWWTTMKTRMRTREGGNYFVWNYWDPAGPWDYKADGSPRHWVGVHPNGGYYAIDVEGIVSAFEHGLVFTRDDLQRLIVTNRDFMWNKQMAAARFQRIDGGPADPRWKDSPGCLWTALVPYDETLTKIFLANHNPASWGGLWVTPWYLAGEQHKRDK